VRERLILAEPTHGSDDMQQLQARRARVDEPGQIQSRTSEPNAGNRATE
jgi:hypothetical protein